MGKNLLTSCGLDKCSWEIFPFSYALPPMCPTVNMVLHETAVTLINVIIANKSERDSYRPMVAVMLLKHEVLLKCLKLSLK